jgi:hypothetical protein
LRIRGYIPSEKVIKKYREASIKKNGGDVENITTAYSPIYSGINRNTGP